jgi:coproporphyrinogen III oxidase-like Fe-S oxidoreductase
VSIVGGHFYVNSFALERYHELINSNQLPIVGWRKLSERENLRYYLLTKLFGMKLDKTTFQQRFGDGIGQKLWLELAFLRAGGVITSNETLRVMEKGMYPVSVMMREFFAALNTLREYCIEHQV